MSLPCPVAVRSAGRRSALAVVGFLAAALSPTPSVGAAPPAAPLAEWAIERLDRELALPAGAGVTIDNPAGDVRVRVGDEDRLTVHAVAQRHRDDPRHERLEAVLEEGSGRVRVIYPEPAGGESAPPASWGRRRVDLAVEVPRGVALAVRTGAGAIEVKGHAGSLRVESGAGDLRLWRRGPVEARSERGAIAVVFLDPARIGPSRLASSTGDVTVELRPESPVAVTLETQGSFTTDFSLEVEPVGSLRKRARAHLGAGGGTLEMTSGHGALRLLRLLPEIAGPGGGK